VPFSPAFDAHLPGSFHAAALTFFWPADVWQSIQVITCVTHSYSGGEKFLGWVPSNVLPTRRNTRFPALWPSWRPSPGYLVMVRSMNLIILGLKLLDECAVAL
jgi:hypothetical protein